MKGCNCKLVLGESEVEWSDEDGRDFVDVFNYFEILDEDGFLQWESYWWSPRELQKEGFIEYLRDDVGKACSLFRVKISPNSLQGDNYLEWAKS